ncbi:hypothetical protein FQZ97_873880 [compost metagenome]
MTGSGSGSTTGSSSEELAGSGAKNSGTNPMGPVGKPMLGSTLPAVSPNNTKECPPPALPAPAPEPGPAAVASAAWVGSTPASMAACSFSTSVRSCWLGAVGALSAVWSGPGWPASSALSNAMLLSRPSTSSWPLAKATATATAPRAPVTNCSPANTRSPSLSVRREPSAPTAKTSPTTCRTTPIEPAMTPSSRTTCCQPGSADPSQ